jgi:endonuclease/exonuclease/phosphatase (EEP) superfamily protein YafD
MRPTPILLGYARLGAMAWAAAAVGIAVAALASGVFARFDLLNQVAPFWLALALAGFAVSWFAFKRGALRSAALASFGFAVLAHAVLVAPEFMRPIPAPMSPAVDAPRVRVVWLNAQMGTAGQGVLDYVRWSGADFVVLAEFHAEAMTPELAQAYPYANTCLEPHWCNVMMLSRHPPLAVRPEREESPSEFRVVWAEYEIDGAPLRLIATHMQRPYPTTRYETQSMELLNVLRGGASENTILAGDFNAVPWSFALRRFDGATGLTRYDRAMVTWPATPWTRLRLPAPEAFMPLDHIYAGSGWRLVSIRRGRRTGADHFPIEAEFVWTGAR